MENKLNISKKILSVILAIVFAIAGLYMIYSAIVLINETIEINNNAYKKGNIMYALQQENMHSLRDSLSYNDCYEPEFDDYWNLTYAYESVIEYKIWETAYNKTREESPDKAQYFEENMERCRNLIDKYARECRNENYKEAIKKMRSNISFP